MWVYEGREFRIKLIDPDVVCVRSLRLFRGVPSSFFVVLFYSVPFLVSSFLIPLFSVDWS